MTAQSDVAWQAARRSMLHYQVGMTVIRLAMAACSFQLAKWNACYFRGEHLLIRILAILRTHGYESAGSTSGVERAGTSVDCGKTLLRMAAHYF